MPGAQLENCFGGDEVLRQYLDHWAAYLLREDLGHIAASVAIGLAGYSGADSLESANAALHHLRGKLRRLMRAL
jgi:hypothetical protein